MNSTADDTRNFILQMAAPPAGPSTSHAATTTFHMVGGVLKPHCYQKKARRKSSKMNRINPLTTATTTSTGASKPKYPKKPPLTPEPDASKIARPCTECGKKFWSWKALFGHMRCHPERQWRGINPPPNFRRPSSSPSDDRQHCYDASSSLSTTIWHHDQCGLPPQVVQQNHLSPSDDYYYSQNIREIMTEEDHEVAACLLLLANKARPPLPDYCCKIDSRSAVGGLDQYSSGGVEGDGGGSKFKRQQVGVGFGISCSSSSSTIMYAHNNNIGGTDNGGGGVIREESINIHSHTCSICLRVFSSGRALGGHKRCHCRDKFRGKDHIHHPLPPPPIVYSSSKVAASTANYLDLNLLPAAAPQQDDSCSIPSSSAALPALDLRLRL